MLAPRSSSSFSAAEMHADSTLHERLLKHTALSQALLSLALSVVSCVSRPVSLVNLSLHLPHMSLTLSPS